MTQLFAQPYDISATGFYFETAEQYKAKAGKARNDYGQPVEEFEIQFIYGDLLDAEFAKAFDVNQVNFERFFELDDEWEEHEKIRLSSLLVNVVIYSILITTISTNLMLIFTKKTT